MAGGVTTEGAVQPAAEGAGHAAARAAGPDLNEKGRSRTGEALTLDRRLFMQLFVFTGCRAPGTVAEELAHRGIHGVLYEDVNDPLGIGLLTFDENPAYFLDTIRPLIAGGPFAGLTPEPDYTMLGRTYSMGWEPDLEEALIVRPKTRVCSPDLPWAVWYPLRRAGAFEELSESEQKSVLAEHGGVGQTFGRAGVAHDVRLACHGLSRDDNDFVIGLLGAQLFPLSAVVQRMRKTRQTSRYLARLGPFFIGRALWQSPCSGSGWPAGVRMSTMPRGGAPARQRPPAPSAATVRGGIPATVRGGIPATVPAAVASSAFLRACRGESSARTPIWLMRQAGRYLPEYRAIRERHTMQALLAQPELAAQITLQPLSRFELDAAIVFTDILPPLAAMGLEIAFRGESGEGPLVVTPLSRPHDIDVLAVPPAVESLGPALQTIAFVKGELDSRGVPLIGFVGAPFTLASYAIEGGGSRTYAKTKALMYSQPAAWGRLMTKLVTLLSDYLVAQARAGASALQVFDSWAGIALGRDDYVRYVQPHNRRLFAAAAAAGVPVINFSTGTASFIEEVAACGGEVIGVDWRMPLGFYRERIGPERAIQGNLDPAALLAPWRMLAPRVDSILEAGGGVGHIFNLGHGILPETPLDTVTRLIERVHGGKGSAS